MEQWYSDAYFTRRQIHVIRKSVRFTLKAREIIIETILFQIVMPGHFFDHFDGDYHSLAAVTSITLENDIRCSKNVFQQHMVTCGYPTLWHMCWYCNRDFQ